MFKNLFAHQKLNFKINYQFRNKYFVIFPFYFSFLLVLSLLSYLCWFSKKNNKHFKKPIFFTFTSNQSKIAELFNKSTCQVHLNFTNFTLNVFNPFSSQNLVFFILKYGVSLKVLFSIFKIKEFSYFKMNWYRICNFIFIERILSEVKINQNLVIIANDHSIYNNFIISWCKFHNVKSMYIQHAPVTLRFPPLRCDYNILFSKSSEEIYSNISKIKVNYEIFSDLRLIKFLDLKDVLLKENKTMLICTNKLDSIDKVNKYIKYFQNKQFKITIRKHPADKRDWTIANTFNSKGLLYDDFKSNQIVLCNETALILEGIICEKLIYKCDFSDFFDNYGYIKDKLVLKEYSSLEDLNLDIIKKYKSYDRSKLNYYIGDLANYKNHMIKINKLINSHNLINSYEK